MAKANGYSLTQGEYAARRGITQPAVAKLIRQGKLEGAFKREGRRYKINPQKADAILATLERPAPAQKQNQDRPAALSPLPKPAAGKRRQRPPCSN
jgi:hypothetical protein